MVQRRRNPEQCRVSERQAGASRVARSVEASAWLLGAALIGLYGAAQLSFGAARAQGVAAFRALNAVDKSLWSEQRALEFASSVLAPGTPEGVLRIPSLRLEVPIYSGATETNLNRGAAHIDGTAALAPRGNIGLAGHRDGFFRQLADVRMDADVYVDVGVRSLRYRVADISVVRPTDVQVLADTEVPSITLVTCYPFYFVGHAPQRYIVRAVLDEALPSAGTN
jgi:sortase A